VPSKYCGTLFELSDEKCPGFRAPEGVTLPGSSLTRSYRPPRLSLLVHPVPEWIVHASLPHAEELHLEFWGPVSAQTGGRLDAGYLVLTNQRLLFLRSAGRARSDLAEGVELPLPEIRRISSSAHGVEVHLKLNFHEFRFIVPGDESAVDLAHRMRAAIVESRQHRVAELRRTPAPAPPDGAPAHPGSSDSPCRYCGTIFPTSRVRCPACGAPRKR
jgi:hypothetical protein